MKQTVIQQINNFGYECHEFHSESHKGLLCYNSQSQNEFHLIFLASSDLIKEGVAIIESYLQHLSRYVVFVLEVNYDLLAAVDILVNAEEKPGISYLLYDPHDDIELFMKDLWNVLILINQHTKSKEVQL